MSDARGPSTIRDVAALAGVSVTTVSNFFNHPERMTATTRDRVGAAVASLGFSPSDAARSLRRGRSTVVGYISFELASARTPAITTAMGDRLAQAGMHLLSAVDGGDPARERAYLELFERQRVAGLVITPVTDLEPELARLRRAGLRSVLSAQRATSPEQPSVSIDHRHGGRLAAKHLLATGRRRLAFVTDTLELHQVSERFQGAMAAVAEHPDATLEVVTCPERSVAGGEDAAAQLLRRPSTSRPEGVFCVNDLVALGLCGGLRHAVSVPQDMGVVGYDDIEFARLGAVPLTTVSSPQERLGVAVAELLLAEIASGGARDDEPRPRQVELEPRLVVRASTTAAP
ncbi:LacI family DNA-binding transcriptional regulator [Nocardioides sp. S-58]|uniref:LacI family DNA-binding transcriptional regulator n=1 Tax=Nocardioides renjunii TaxID=3095075 RepID=A0ABU5KF02_9ACTN|nr:MULTISPECIES: LacI family DNA-binding transcriptional regulator [unclassified Nocardioides]MDZ5663412.1 LacI family DNA-binding transcriptional regulator [Nocardioides sp. S-58]WQQ22719.1 LacI family DNA-binding transcriptional regulator [Nocardioides sp. S-34]